MKEVGGRKAHLVANETTIEVRLRESIPKKRNNRHRIKFVGTTQSFYICTSRLSNESGPNSSEIDDILAVVCLNYVAIRIEFWRPVSLELHKSDCKQLHNFTREILVRKPRMKHGMSEHQPFKPRHFTYCLVLVRRNVSATERLLIYDRDSPISGWKVVSIRMSL